MAINMRTFVLSAVAENAIGVPLQRGLPIALFASTFRGMTGLIFALLLGRSVTTSAPSGYTIVVPPVTPSGTTTGGTGPGGGAGTGAGTGTGGGTGGKTMPASMPSFLHLKETDAKAWAAFFGLQPTFEKSGPIVIHQNPHVGASMPNDNTVALELGHHVQT